MPKESNCIPSTKQMPLKPLPMGVDGFRKLRETGCYYCDKTLMIAEFLKGNAKATLITRPCRFGKTLNMDIIKEFFDIDRDSKAIFENLAITNTPYYAEMNTRPVIFLSFRDCKGELPMLVFKVKQELLREYKRFAAVGSKLDESEQQDYQTMLCSLCSTDADVVPISKAIAYLSEIVSKHYGNPPIALIDAYDTPVTSAYSESCYDKLRSFFTSLYGSALKGNPYLDRAILTGVQHIAKESILSGLNNLVICTVNDKAYSPYFGFDAEETKQLLDTYNLELNETVKELYDGYRFAGCKMHNPWSVLSYASTGKLMPYWMNTSSNVLIRKCVLAVDEAFFEQFNQLTLTGSVKVAVNQQTFFFERPSNETLWGMLLCTGYITVVEELDLLASFCEVRIPNREVQTEFRSILCC